MSGNPCKPARPSERTKGLPRRQANVAVDEMEQASTLPERRRRSNIFHASKKQAYRRWGRESTPVEIRIGREASRPGSMKQEYRRIISPD